MTIKLIFIWGLRLIAAIIMLQTLYFKFTAHPQSIALFTTIGLEPYGRIGIGILELIASILILIPRTTALGSLLGIGLMSGALFFHFTSLGIQFAGDYVLFIYSLTVFLVCAILLFIYRNQFRSLQQILRMKILKTQILNTILLISISILFTNCSFSQKNNSMPDKQNKFYSREDTTKLKVSDKDWELALDPMAYNIAREKGTERAFTGEYWNHTEVGTYRCKACGNALFKSEGKFESSCGWPSFFEPISEGSVKYEDDNSHGMKRIEVMCGRCDAHLGHIFDDGPPPTYKRYCINSVIIDFEKK